VRELSEASERIALGMYDIHLRSKGRDELGLLAAGFERMAHKLRESDEHERNFLMRISHELRTPLTAIQGHVQLLADGLLDDPDEQQASLEVVLVEADRLQRLIGDLLDLAKLEARRFSLNREHVDLDALCTHAAHARGAAARTASLELSAPAAFGPYWNGDVLLAKSSDGNEEKLVVERPLFSHTAPYTLSFAFDHLLQDARVYASGEVSSVFRQQHREVAVTAGSTLFSTSTGATRLLYGVDLLDDSFRALRGVEPSDRDFRFIEVGADTTNLIFRRLDHVDFGMRAQDFDISAHAAMIGGWSPPTRGRGVVWRVRANGSDGFLLSPNTLVVSSVAASMRAGDSNRNVVVSSDTHFVVRLDTTLPQAFVARLRVDRGSDLDRDVEFFADGQNGLRAYPNFAFAGASRVVFNAEHRVYLGRELLDLFEPGAALFIDSGRAGRGALRTDVGAGFRIGIARFQSAMLRFDVAYAMNNSPLSRRGLVFSFATTQAF